MKKIRFKDSLGQNDELGVVNDFPYGYVVWNIGRHNFPCECYVPIARYIGDYRVDKPKCIKVKDEQTALKIMDYASHCKGFVERDKFITLASL